MSHLQRPVLRALLLAASAMLACLAFLTATARAEFGEEARFGELTPAGDLHEGASGIGVDPRDNSVYVLEELKEVENSKEGISTRTLRLVKYSLKAGVYTKAAGVTFVEKSPLVEFESGENAIEGVAVDPAHNLVYVLTVDLRTSQLHDHGSAVASTVYAFKTEGLAPAGTKGEKSEILTGPGELETQSDTPGAPLLEPSGITVDPENGDVIILAHEDHAGMKRDEPTTNPEDHYVLQRVESSGKVGERYVDSGNFFKKGVLAAKPDSPVVVGPTGAEHVLVNYEGLVQLPAKFASKEAPKVLFEEPHVKAAIPSGTETATGGLLSVSPEGKIFGTANIKNEEGPQSGTFYGVFARSATDGSELGWTGGQSPVLSNERSEGDRCVLQPGTVEGLVPVVAAGSGGKVFVLASEFLRRETEPGSGELVYGPPFHPAVIEFGPGAASKEGGCPKGSAGIPKAEVIKEGEPVPAGTTVTYASQLKQADALSVEWEFTNTTTKATEIEIKTTDEFRLPKVKHKFTAPGEWTIKAKIHTNDLATPELVTTVATLKVSPTAPTAQFSWAPTFPTVGVAATFDGSLSSDPNGAGPLEYVWEFDKVAEKPSLLPTIAHTFATEGPHTVTLKVIDKLKLEGTTTASVTVVPPAKEPPKEPPKEAPKGGEPPKEAPKSEVKGSTEQHVPPAAHLAGTSITVSKSGALTLKITCPVGVSTCSGTVTLRTASAVSAAAKKKI
ncbi:MAG TPA: PKD domain-containing protein, partial [Solirubrobacteraceae bacterium]|nr:PKD domain-containing protein [Solirubrobacteraceae bacterium]